jgi:hypothetical protein
MFQGNRTQSISTTVNVTLLYTALQSSRCILLNVGFQFFNNFFYFHLDISRWETVARTNSGPLQEFSVSFQSLLPSTAYNFRVISFNRYGISYPAYSDVTILTPSKLYLEYGYLQVK